MARKEKIKPRSLTEIDYLIGVYDETRMGGLRFSASVGGDFLSNDKELGTPPWTTLRKLKSASLAFEKNEDGVPRDKIRKTVFTNTERKDYD